jgi:DNA-directed RNA polymerase subunit RPC12/RpoP
MTSETSGKSAAVTGVKVAVIVLAIAGAGYFAFLRGEEQQLDTPESAGAYVCLDCGEPFSLTPAAYERLSKSGGVKSARGEDDRGGQLRFRCPHCEKFGGVPALVCPNDGSSIPTIFVRGKPNKCPKCGWSP